MEEDGYVKLVKNKGGCGESREKDKDFWCPWEIKARPVKRYRLGDSSLIKADRATLFLVVPEDVTRGNSHTWWVGRLRLYTRETFSTWCPREVTEAPSLEVLG